MSAGTVDGSATEPAVTPLVTYTGGDWNASTDIYVAPVGADMTEAVVGRFASVYNGGDTAPTTNQWLVGRITAVNAGTRQVTLSTTARANLGTEVATGTGNRTMRVGGAWAGPSGASGFPLTLGLASLTNAAADPHRLNLRNDQVYAITAAIALTSGYPTLLHGYAASYGDGGRAVLDGGTAGASYSLLATSSVGNALWVDALHFRNNGSTGSAAGLALTGSGAGHLLTRCVVSGMVGPGISTAGSFDAVECEFRGNGTANALNSAGAATGGRAGFLRCTFHHNAGSNVHGLRVGTNSGASVAACVFDSNGAQGLEVATNLEAVVTGCDFYNNGAGGLNQSTTTARCWVENCTFVANAGWGIGGANFAGSVANCAFGAGAQANASGAVQSTRATESGRVTLASGATPWQDAPDGDFRIVLGQVKGTGRGQFLQTASGYAGTVAYPDIGAAQSRAYQGNLTDYAELTLMNGTAQPATLHAKMHVGDPGEAGTANASAHTARAAFARSPSADGTATNAADVQWTALAAAETVTHISLWDAASGGNPWWYGPLDAPVATTSGGTLTIPAGQLRLVLL